MKIAVIGLGYIGLPTALIMAAAGNQVVGIDLNPKIIKTLEGGHVTFEEEGLEELFAKAKAQDISFTSEYIPADVYIVSVPTPYNKESKKIDPQYVVNASQMVCHAAPKGAIIVIESTISPGVIDTYVRPAIEATGKVIGEDIYLAHAPERIIPGNMVYELEHNSRTIGTDSEEIGQSIKKIYESFCRGEIILTDIRTAELSKVVENTYRDINIAYANELSRICHEAGTDVYEVIRIANHHPRVNILTPGPGVGGHCISVDPWFLVGDFPEHSQLIHTARLVNDGQPRYILDRAKAIMDAHNISDFSKVGLYGLTYKENVDDTRESPSLQLLEILKEEGISGVKIYDPFIKEDVVDNQMHDLKAFIDASELIIIMVSHKEIKDKQEMLQGKLIFDTKKSLDLVPSFTL